MYIKRYRELFCLYIMLSPIIRIGSGEREHETVTVKGSGRCTVGIAVSIFGKIVRDIREASITPCSSVWLVSLIRGNSRVGLRIYCR